MTFSQVGTNHLQVHVKKCLEYICHVLIILQFSCQIRHDLLKHKAWGPELGHHRLPIRSTGLLRKKGEKGINVGFSFSFFCTMGLQKKAILCELTKIFLLHN